MSFGIGSKVWLPCEVRPGPFSDERLVRVSADTGPEWVGFVETRWLREPLAEGYTEVLSIVVEVRDDTFAARIPGHTPTGQLFEGLTKRAKPSGSLQARA